MSASTPRRRRWTSGPPSRSACRRRRRSSRRRGWKSISRGRSANRPTCGEFDMAHKNKWTAPLRERDITRQIAREHFQEFDRLIESDVIVVGAGPSGLLCARDLAAAGFKTLLIEQALQLGGGFWSGGYLMNKATICAPADRILDELKIPPKPVTECEGMFILDPPHPTAKPVAPAYDAGRPGLNLAQVHDLILRRANIL